MNTYCVSDEHGWFCHVDATSPDAAIAYVRKHFRGWRGWLEAEAQG